MDSCTVKLLRKEEVAERTMAFHFEKPAGFSFKPGQTIDVVLPGAGQGNADDMRHTFSIVSAPYEADLTIATRMRDSAFKQALRAMSVGEDAALEGPFGSLTLHNKRARPAILLAGGIGITPFVSMLRQAMHDALPQQLILLYSNRRPEDAAFLPELQQLVQQNGQFRLVATMTQMDASAQPWDGETGVIDESLIRKICVDLAEPVYYLAGPPGLVQAVRQVLNRADVDDDDIRSEDFFGY